MDEKRFNELYNRAYSREYTVFSDFLDMNEQSILEKMHLPHKSFGGYDMAERAVAGFGEETDDSDFPITCLCIEPVRQKFADALTHRDFLGSLMNLGIKRELLGDIIVEGNCGYLFCLNRIAPYIVDNLSRVKHTTVRVSTAESLPNIANEMPSQSQIIVSSARLDSVISAVYKLSRSESASLFNNEKVFVNSRLTEHGSHNLKEGDKVSVRGFGRFVYDGLIRKTKKDHLAVGVRIYR
ncbi:MAG: YlmH/Sll1252 family protein [Clostridiales bacterium]|nr:YlmH/Sll1252 family protein [Clostridiales bacterium]